MLKNSERLDLFDSFRRTVCVFRFVCMQRDVRKINRSVSAIALRQEVSDRSGIDVAIN